MEVKKYIIFKERYHNKTGYKEAFLKKYNGRKICECGTEISGLNYFRHLKSEKHKKLMLLKNPA
jgi:hypothetical protein